MSKLSETPSANSSENLAGPATALGAEFPPLEFSPEQRRALLGIAHQAILYSMEHRPFVAAAPASAALSEPRGVFTTLYLNPGEISAEMRGEVHREVRRDASIGSALHRQPHRQLQLRGCVGYAEPVAPLYRAVAETARAAAFEDSRFFPVTKQEVPRLEISLSVLSRLFPIPPEAVETGRHGLVISQGGRRGLLLPQVSTENNWDRETFLGQTCRKAGLPEDAWRNGACIEAFTAEVFSDADVELA
jgi:uncharacterized protein